MRTKKEGNRVHITLDKHAIEFMIDKYLEQEVFKYCCETNDFEWEVISVDGRKAVFQQIKLQVAPLSESWSEVGVDISEVEVE